MGQLRIMGYDSGDDRSNACVEVEVESDGLVMYGAILEESIIELYYVKKGQVIWTNFVPVVETWVGRENKGCEFRKLKAITLICADNAVHSAHSFFLDIVGEVLSDTPAMRPRASENWSDEMEDMEMEFETRDFKEA